MVEQALDLPDAQVAWDLRTDVWHVRCGSRTWQVRRWTWGERARLLQWASTHGTLDTERFVTGLLDLLVEPSALAEERAWLASVTLELLGVRPDSQVVPIGEAARVAASQLGWGPCELERQPLPAVDELLAAFNSHDPGAVDDGWNHIMVDDG